MTTPPRRLTNTVRLLLAPVFLGCALVGVTLAAADWNEFVVLCTDYSTVGELVVVERYSPWSCTGTTEPVGPDPVGRFHDGLYYIVNRGGASNLQIIDPDANYQTVSQFSLGSDRNPQDIAFRDDGIAFVSCYEEAVLLKVDVAAGTILDTYSTAAFADADGLPETAWMQAVGHLLYIAVQRLDSENWYVPTGLSLLAIFDMTTETWVDVIPGSPELDGIVLTGESPYTQLELSPDRQRLRVGCNGWYGSLDGGIEIVDLATRTSLGFEVTESTLGGDLIDFETVADTLGCVSVADAAFATSLVVYDPVTGGGVSTILSAGGYAYHDLAYDGAGLLYVVDRTYSNPGLRVVSLPDGTELTTSPIDCGLPPHFVVLPRDEALTATPPTVTSRLQLSPPWPNPSNPGCTVQLRGAPHHTVELGIYDLRGRRVRGTRVQLDGAGEGRYFFDGSDDSGRPVASGSYRAVAEAERIGRVFTLVR
ncbi:MAG: FlgD immunoglobulin-like domain containing protein [bacterium]